MPWLVTADRQALAQPADETQQCQGEQGVAGRIGEGLGDGEDAHGAAGDLQVQAHHPQDLHQGDGGDGEVGALQAQHQGTDARSQHATKQGRQGHFQQQGGKGIGRRDGGARGAGSR